MADGYRFDILEKRAERKAHLDDIGVATLPDQPGKRGYSAAESRMHFKAPVDYLFSLLCGCMEEVGSEFDGYAPLSGADFTGDVTIGGSLSVSGGIACDGSSVLFEKDISELRATVAKHENNLYAYISHSDEEGALVATEIIKGVSPDKGDDGDALATTEWTNGAIAEEASVREAKDDDLEASIEALRKDFDDLKSVVYGIHSLTYNSYEFSYLTSSIIPDEVDGRKVVGGSYAIMDWVGGNSVAFNQLYYGGDLETQTISGVTFTKNQDGTYTLNGTATADIDQNIEFSYRTLNSTHKYLLKGCAAGGSTTTYYLKMLRLSNYDIGNGVLENANSNGASRINIVVKSGTTINNLVFKPQLFDLTRMPLDNITTVSEFNAMFPDDYYPYNAGEIKSTIVSKIEAYSTEGVKLGEIIIPNAPLKLDGVNDIHNTLTFEEQEDGTYNAILTKNNGEYTFTGEEALSSYGTAGYYVAGTILTNAKKGSGLVSDYFADSSKDINPIANGTSVCARIATNTIYFSTVTDGNKLSVSETQALIKGKKVLYPKSTPTTEVIATGLTFDDTNFKIEKGGTIKAIYEGVPTIASIDFMTKGE